MKTNTFKRTKKNSQSLLAIIFILLIGTASFLFFLKNLKKTPNLQQSYDQCTNDGIRSSKFKDIQTVIANNQPNEFKKIVDDIVSIPNYKNDQNCLYPIVKYYLLIGNSAKARENFALYEKVYVSNEKYLTHSLKLHY